MYYIFFIIYILMEYLYFILFLFSIHYNLPVSPLLPYFFHLTKMSMFIPFSKITVASIGHFWRTENCTAPIKTRETVKCFFQYLQYWFTHLEKQHKLSRFGTSHIFLILHRSFLMAHWSFGNPTYVFRYLELNKHIIHSSRRKKPNKALNTV